MNRRNVVNEELIKLYWADHANEYPKLSKIMLAIVNSCPSSAEIERQFSRMSNILTQKRSRLGDSRLLTILQTAELENLEKIN